MKEESTLNLVLSSAFSLFSMNNGNYPWKIINRRPDPPSR